MGDGVGVRQRNVGPKLWGAAATQRQLLVAKGKRDQRRRVLTF